MKINEITIDEVKSYLRVDGEEDDLYIAGLILTSKSYIKNYTGLSEEGIDAIEELGQASLMLIADLYENRSIHVDEKGLNRIYDSIIAMHSVNLL